MRRGDAEVFAALLARVDAAQLRALSSGMLDEELHSVHATLTDALAAMQSVQEVQTRIATLERQQAVIGIPSGRTDCVMALVGETQRLNGQLLRGIARFPDPSSLQVRRIYGAVRVGLQQKPTSEFFMCRSFWCLKKPTPPVAAGTLSENAICVGEGDADAIEAIDRRADGKDEAPEPPPIIHQKRSFKEAVTLRAPIGQETEDVQRREQTFRQRGDGRTWGTIEAPALVTVAEASGSDTEAEYELIAEPKRTVRQLREHNAATEKSCELPRQVLQDNLQVTTLWDLRIPEANDSPSTVQIPQLIKQNGESKSEQDHVQVQHEEQRCQLTLEGKEVPSLDAEPQPSSQQPREHIMVMEENTEAQQEDDPVVQLLKNKEQLEFEEHLQQLLKQEQEQELAHEETPEADVLDVVMTDRPMSISDNENRPTEVTVATTFTATQQPVLACEAQGDESETVVQWSQLTDDARSGANVFATFPPELKINRLNYILQPLQILFSKIVESPVSANRDLTQLDCDFIEWAVETATESIKIEPIPSYRLNGHRYFLETMDAAMARVEKLSSLLTQYVIPILPHLLPTGY